MSKYVPSSPAQIKSLEEMSRFLYQELNEVSTSIEDVEFALHQWILKSYSEPDKPREGMLVHADGTKWDPGSGHGIYFYDEDQWNFLMTVPTAGLWDDYIASMNAAKVTGASQPSWSAFRDGIYAYAFSASSMNESWVTFHILHDYKRGTDLFPHVHWSPGTSTHTGVVRWGIEYQVAKGHTQEAFPATTTVYVEQASDGTQYMHNVAEVTAGAAISGTDIEPDSLVNVRVFRDGAHANDTFTGPAFVFQIDMHYLKERTGTKNKAPNFYD